MTGTAAQKVVGFDELIEFAEIQRRAQRRIVLCHGHFNSIHPGHMRFLGYAREQGDVLVIAVMRLDDLSEPVRQTYFDQQARALGVAAVEIVDTVFPLDRSIEACIEALRPDVYVKGKEFESQRELIAGQLAAVEQGGGRVVFGSGDVQYASAEFPSLTNRAQAERTQRFLETCHANGIRPSALVERLKSFERAKLLVVGDTIVDQFVSCDVLGVSAEAPVMTIRELYSKDFIGGAAVVAAHIQSLGAACTYVSAIGNDPQGEFLVRELAKLGVAHLIVHDDSRPTTHKIRYLVDNQKLLRVSRLRQHALHEQLENSVIDRIARRLPGMDGVVVSDFVYGVVTPRVLEAVESLARKHRVKLFGDVQCSSQTGDASKLRGMTLLTPTEKEARIAMGDFTSGVEALAGAFLKKTGSENLVLKLGASGLVAYAPRAGTDAFRPVYFPALEANPVDVSGAGDALLAVMAIAMSGGLDVISAAALGSCAAAISVSRVGNVPVTSGELVSLLERLQGREAGYSL
ncbi:MAG: PfkB family carbohydrate kinase [Deltaproteobacteria bacterium]